MLTASTIVALFDTSIVIAQQIAEQQNIVKLNIVQLLEYQNSTVTTYYYNT